jgi:hypothetical protein
MDKKESTRAEIERLYRLYYQLDKEFESAKMKRTVLTILGFAVVFFWILCQLMSPSGWDILKAVVFALIWSGIHFFVNACIFGPLASKGRDEGDRLRDIKKKISELEKEL